MQFDDYGEKGNKQRVFSWFFRGVSLDSFNRLCVDFAQQNKQLLRPAGIKRLQKAVQEEDSVVLIISASVDNWVHSFPFHATPLLVDGEVLYLTEDLQIKLFKKESLLPLILALL